MSTTSNNCDPYFSTLFLESTFLFKVYDYIDAHIETNEYFSCFYCFILVIVATIVCH